MFTARPARIAIVPNDSTLCVIISIFAHLVSGGVSVGENAVLVVNARNR